MVYPNKRRKTQCDVEPTQKEFTEFILARSYDIISDNQYRKYLVSRKESGDAWAVNLQSSISNVQASSRAISGMVQALNEGFDAGLKAVCSEILLMSEAPTHRVVGSATCRLTGIRSEQCIDLASAGSHKSDRARGKSKEKKEAQLHLAQQAGIPIPNLTTLVIHPKFEHFALMLWYAGRIEHIVRNYARYWLVCALGGGGEGTGQDVGERDTTSLCATFAKQTDVFDNMHGVYCHALQHVRDSLVVRNGFKAT
jgi:hypothetical protein